MRWWSAPIILALAWFAYTLTPLWALYDLAQAVKAHDAAYVERHVNFRTLRLSVIRQGAAAVRQAGEGEGEPRERQGLIDAAVGLATPLVETLITAESVIDLLDDGWPQSVEEGEEKPADLAFSGLRIESLGRLARFYLASEMRGFRTVVVSAPPGAPRGRQLRLRLRLRGWVWRLVDIEMTDALRDRMAQRLSRLYKDRVGRAP